jgi:hypothetical protein
MKTFAVHTKFVEDEVWIMNVIYGGINGKTDIVWRMFEQRDSPFYRLMGWAGSCPFELRN